MDSLIKQTRSRYAGSKEDRSSSTTDKKIPPQKTQSFREKKRSLGWTKRQVSRQMSWEYDFSSSEYPTAIAAAAFAIQSLEESSSWDEKQRDYGNHKSLSKTDEMEKKPEPLKSALKSSDEKSKSSFDYESSMRKGLGDKRPTKKISFADMDEISNGKVEKLPQQKAPEGAPPMKRPPTFADQLMPQPMTTTTRPGPGDAAADAWEKEEMISIKERYEKLRDTIDNWEMKKKSKVKGKIERAQFQAELDERKAKNIKRYNGEIARIEEIAHGARAQAEENRRREELKVKEKANKIRATGKIPPTCLCF